jgi:hypothetical protein
MEEESQTVVKNGQQKIKLNNHGGQGAHAGNGSYN